MIRRQKEILGHVATLIILAAASAVAHAGQSDSTEDKLLDCDTLESQEARMACFDELVKQLRGAPAVSETDDGVAAEVAEAPPVSELEEVAADTPESPPAEINPVTESTGVVGEVSAATQMEASRTVEASVESESASQDSNDSGMVITDRAVRQEDLEPPEEIFEPFTATIVSVREHLDGRFSVVLDNGQVWRETQKTRIRTPRAGRTVEVKEGRLGGFQMVVEGIPTAAWVRRTR